MARTIAGKVGTLGLACVLTLASLTSIAPGEEGTPPPLSPQCEVPQGSLAAPAPLSHLAEGLQNKRPVRILAIGSSSTAGIGASSGAKSYPSQFGAILGKALKDNAVEVINRGVSGEVAKNTADRIRSEVAVQKPDLVLWQLGTNDAVSRVPPEEFEATVRDTVQWLKENNIDVVLVGLQYTSRFARDAGYFAIVETLRKVAAAQNVLYIRRFEAMRFISQSRANLQMMASDNFHLNDLGYQCMAEHVAQAVIAAIFVKRFRPVER